MELKALVCFVALLGLTYSQPIDDCLTCGADYWCKDVETATKCGTVEYCKLMKYQKFAMKEEAEGCVEDSNVKVKSAEKQIPLIPISPAVKGVKKDTKNEEDCVYEVVGEKTDLKGTKPEAKDEDCEDETTEKEKPMKKDVKKEEGKPDGEECDCHDDKKEERKIEREEPTVASPVNVSLYYEALCPGCRQLLMTQYFPTYAKLKNTGILNINLYPYGNAQEYWNGYSWQFRCQHGSSECIVNTLETCAMNVLPAAHRIPFVQCMETTPYITYGSYCAQRVGADWKRLRTCYQGKEGNNLQHQVALKTSSLNPRHQYVPWVTVNGVHTNDIQNRVSSNMLSYVCSLYRGTKPAACTRDFVEDDCSEIQLSYRKL